jgi:UPF0271 protein
MYKKLRLDINADMGEGYGAYRVGDDKKLMSYISSANIACGFHAGDYLIMDRTVSWAIDRKVKIGAHPGYPDLAGFGRRAMAYSLEELQAQLLYQIGALKEMVQYKGGQLNHIKPHGALYHLATSHKGVAIMMAETLASIDGDLSLVGMYESEMRLAAEKCGIPYLNEVFADRRYKDNGQLVDRSEKDAVITDADGAYKAPIISSLKLGSIAFTLSPEMISRFGTPNVSPLTFNSFNVAISSSLCATTNEPIRLNGTFKSLHQSSNMALPFTLKIPLFELHGASYPAWIMALFAFVVPLDTSLSFSKITVLSWYFDSTRATDVPIAPAPIMATSNMLFLLVVITKKRPFQSSPMLNRVL